MRKIIFLDIDGVLNHNDFYKKYPPEIRNAWRDLNEDEFGDMFSPESIHHLNVITDVCNAEIVISSTKRLDTKGDLKLMQEIMHKRGINGKLVGITPYMRYNNSFKATVPRGCEIKFWLEMRGFTHINWNKDIQEEYIKSSGISNYIIIDDDSDMLYEQRNHFIHTLPPPRHYAGLDEKYCKEAIYKLSKTVIDLNY